MRPNALFFLLLLNLAGELVIIYNKYVSLAARTPPGSFRLFIIHTRVFYSYWCYLFLNFVICSNTTNSKSKDFYTINVFCDGSILCNKDALVCSNGRQNYIRNISDLCAPLTPLQVGNQFTYSRYLFSRINRR